MRKEWIFHNSFPRFLKHLFLKPTLPDRRGWDRYGSLRDVPAEPHRAVAVVLAAVAHVAIVEAHAPRVVGTVLGT